MGGALGGIFSGKGEGTPPPGAAPGTPAPPSTLQKLFQSTVKGAGMGLGQSMQSRTPGSGTVLPGAPSATPVDAGYFTPSATPPRMMMPNGGAPGNAPSPFYG